MVYRNKIKGRDRKDFCERGVRWREKKEGEKWVVIESIVGLIYNTDVIFTGQNII